MQYIHAWSHLSDAMQCVAIFFLATTLCGFALVAYGIAANIKRIMRNNMEW